MTAEYLSLFRGHLLAWFEARLSDGQTPFRRAEETPPLLVRDGVSPDLVLWINRDSLLAGAVILIPERTDPPMLQRGAATALALGLNQFITWEAAAVNLWQLTGEDLTVRKSWRLPSSRQLTALDFAVVGDSVLQELKLSAITGSCLPKALPAEHFVNLCLLNLRVIQPLLEEAMRIAPNGAPREIRHEDQALAKGWMTLWRLLALLWSQRLPSGVAPERLEQAMTYAIAELPACLPDRLAITDNEVPLPTPAAVRFQHLAGRLAQLKWAENRQRAVTIVDLLLGESSQHLGVDRFAGEAGVPELLVNRLPQNIFAEGVLVAPRPCLAGFALLGELNGTPLTSFITESVIRLPQGWRPQHVDARLNHSAPPSPWQRRQLATALRRAWPYRRFVLPSTTPAWIWEALFLLGSTSPDGTLRLRLPAGWATLPGAELFWQMLGEQRALGGLMLETDGGQTLELLAIEEAPATITVQTADGANPGTILPTTEIPLEALSRLGSDELPSPVGKPSRGPSLNSLRERIETKVFRDGLPRFPDDYLRRRDAVPLCTYELPGPLWQEASFFGFCRLLGPAGELLDIDSPVTAEALILASLRGPRQVSLPHEPLITAELVRDYQADLEQLWGDLQRECRRLLSREQQARSMARQIWQGQSLPPVFCE